MDLVSAYHQLAGEARRRDASVRDAADAAALALQAARHPSSSSSNASQAPALSELACLAGPSAKAAHHVLLLPITSGCLSKNAKVVTLALNCLQRLLISSPLRPALGPAAVQPVISALRNVSNHAVESQLKILQVLPTLLSAASANVHRDSLFDSLLLCFRLQESKVGVVSSTAAATLRQMVIILFDGVVEEDHNKQEQHQQQTEQVILYPEKTSVSLRPSALDAFDVLQDLCNLISSPPAPANHLQLSNLPKTFGLELVESVLSDFPALFHSPDHPELQHLLKHALSPLLIRSLAGENGSPPAFSVTLRLMRVIFLLLKGFSNDLPTECEIFWQMLIKIINSGEAEPPNSHPFGAALGLSPPPQAPLSSPSASTSAFNVSSSSDAAASSWMRVLALEIFRGLCSDFDLLRRMFERYDLPHVDTSAGKGKQQASASSGHGSNGLLVSLFNALSRLASERPSLLGVGQQVMMGTPASGADFSVSGMVDAALGSSQSSGPPAEFSAEKSSVKLQYIDQLDKADAPVMPETYMYLLALQCLSALATGFHHATQSAFNDYATQRCVKDSGLSPSAPPAFEEQYAETSPATTHLLHTRHMIDATWSSLLYSLSFFLSTALSDELFTQVLTSFHAFTVTCGMLNLTTPRDAFIASICKFALPSVVMASINASPASHSGSGGGSSSESGSLAFKASTAAVGVLATGADALGLTSANAPQGQVLSLSSRNLQCLRSLLHMSDQMAGMLNSTWYAVCETVTNAEYALRARASAKKKPDETDALAAISRLFEATSVSLDDRSFKCFIQALGKLSGEMIGLPPAFEQRPVSAIPETVRRRASSVSPSKMLRANDKSLILSRMGDVAVLNIHRLLYRDPEVAWKVVVAHLLSVQHWPPAPPSLRVQSAQTLDMILDSAGSTVLDADKEHQAEIQGRLIQALRLQAANVSQTLETTASATDVEIRKRSYDTLFKLLESNGHSLLCGWTDIFVILKGVCPDAEKKTDRVSAQASARHTSLIAASFPSVQLIASDFLAALNPEELRLCVETLAAFGRQEDDVNIALTAGGLLWQVSDHLQALKRSSSDDAASRTFNDLWLSLLLELLHLAEDRRHEVRNGAIQILFRCLESYGSMLSTSDWDTCLWDVLLPLLRHLSVTSQEQQTSSVDAKNDDPLHDPHDQIDESRVLVLTSTGSLVAEYMSTKLMPTPRFSQFWSALAQQLETTFLQDRAKVAGTAANQLEKLIASAVGQINTSQTAQGDVDQSLSTLWETWHFIGQAIQSRASQPKGDTEDLSQPTLEAYIRALGPLQQWSQVLKNVERSRDILRVLKTIVTWTRSPDYRPDIDSLPPLQAAALEAIQRLDQSNIQIASTVLSDLAEYFTLPYLAAFEIEPVMPRTLRKLPKQRITFIALSKAVMPRAASLFLQNQSSPQMYASGAAEQLLKAHSIPLKLKYECPPASKFGSDPPLWRTATLQMLRLTRACVTELSTLDVLPNVFEAIWRQTVGCYTAALQADSRPMAKSSAEEQRQAENFDLSILASLEQDILPHLARSPAVSDEIVCQLAASLQTASCLYGMDVRSPKSDDVRRRDPRFSSDFRVQATEEFEGTSASILPHSGRERYGFWCFDMLFAICQARDSTKEDPSDYQRLARLFLPFLMDRCVACFKTYLADAALRGKTPFPRIRDEEVYYVVERLSQLSLFEGSFRISITTDGPEFSPIQSALMSSDAAHLFRVMPLLTSMLTLPHISNAGVTTSNIPYRLTKAAQGLKGLPEGVMVGDIGSPFEVEKQLPTTSQYITRCLDRAARLVAI